MAWTRKSRSLSNGRFARAEILNRRTGNSEQAFERAGDQTHLFSGAVMPRREQLFGQLPGLAERGPGLGLQALVQMLEIGKVGDRREFALYDRQQRSATRVDFRERWNVIAESRFRGLVNLKLGQPQDVIDGSEQRMPQLGNLFQARVAWCRRPGCHDFITFMTSFGL